MGDEEDRRSGGHRSNYGLKEFTVEQIKEQWREAIRHEYREATQHTIISSKNEDLKKAWKVVDSPYMTGEKPLDEIAFFNTGKKSEAPSIYDRTFHIQHGYCSKLKRDDRQHSIALNVHAEESNKVVPSLSSSQYGRRPALEVPSRKYVRIATVKRDFYRESGANITGNV